LLSDYLITSYVTFLLSGYGYHNSKDKFSAAERSRVVYARRTAVQLFAVCSRIMTAHANQLPIPSLQSASGQCKYTRTHSHQ